MSSINPKLQNIIDDFAQSNHLTKTQYHNLTATITASPELNERLNTAADKGYLQKIAPLDPRQNPTAAASYSSGTSQDAPTVKIRIDMLNETDKRIPLIFQLGHEIQHGFYHYEQGGLLTEQKVRRDIAGIAKSDQPVKDYTPPLKEQLTSDRNNEALAMITGWNAVVSHVRQNNSAADFKTVVSALGPKDYASFFITDPDSPIPTPAKNLTLNPDMTIPATPANREVLARTYFDTVRMGRSHGSNYTNENARHYIGFIVQEHNKHNPSAKLVIDMKQLGLNEKAIEENGLDLGREGRRETYFDKRQPKVPQHFDHTASGVNQNRHVPLADPQAASFHEKFGRIIDAYRSGDMEAFRQARRDVVQNSPEVMEILARHQEKKQMQKLEQEREERLFSLPNMPREAQNLYRQVEEKLTAYVKEHNLPYTERSLQNSITALTAAAYREKMPDIGQVSVHNGHLAAKSDTALYIHDFASVDAQTAARTPERDSFQNILQSEQEHEREAQQRELQRQMEQHSPSRGFSR